MIDTVIVTYNNAATIARCLASLPKDCAPVVVDNASQDATSAAVLKAGVALHKQAHNTGFAAASNLGASVGEAPYIFFLNPDAYLAAASLAPALHYLEDHASAAALGFQLVSPAGKVEMSFGSPVSFISLFTSRRRASLARRDAPASPTEVGWVSGGALIVRRSAFENVGGFDPQFFLYWEDIDLGKRLSLLGWRLVYFPGIQVVHERGGSLASITQKTRLYDESADKYFRKHYSRVIWLTQHLLRRLYRISSPQVR